MRAALPARPSLLESLAARARHRRRLGCQPCLDQLPLWLQECSNRLRIEEGFRRWLAELAETIWELSKVDEGERVTQAVGVLHSGLRSHRGLINAFLAAVSRAPTTAIYARSLRAAMPIVARASRRYLA